MEMEQMTLFDLTDNPVEQAEKLAVVKASFVAEEKRTWQELFDGFDELYAITYSSGLAFTSKILQRFSYGRRAS